MRSIRRLVLVLAVVFTAAMPLMTGTAHASDASDESAFIADINQLRASVGVGPLTPDSRLTDMARTWAGTMAAAGTIWHNPNLASQAPSGWSVLGENVGVGGSEPSLHAAFVASPHHYANLVDARFQQIGIGVVHVGGTMYVAEEFMKNAGGAQPVTVAPTPPPPPAAPVAVAQGMGTTQNGSGYWVVSNAGAVYAYGDAPFLGAANGTSLSQPVVHLAPTPTNGGYWLVASDGGIFSYG